jgi:hypothetical protein
MIPLIPLLPETVKLGNPPHIIGLANIILPVIINSMLHQSLSPPLREDTRLMWNLSRVPCVFLEITKAGKVI